MYLEFLFLVYDYFKTLSLRTFIYEWLLPALIGLLSFVSIRWVHLTINYTLFVNSSITLLGVLLGFSIMVITIFTTSSNPNIEAIKTKMTEYTIFQNKISLYRLLLINFSYLIIAQSFVILSFFIGLLVKSFLPTDILTVLFSVFSVFIFHIILLTIRNITDFYFIITK